MRKDAVLKTLHLYAGRMISYIRRQPHNFKVMLARRSIQAVGMNLAAQYNSLYATALGASPVHVGSLQSVGNGMSAFASILAGWFIDRSGTRTIFLVGAGMLVASGLLFFAAPHWVFLYAGIMFYYMGLRITCTCCSVTGAIELVNTERATGRGLCRTLASIVTITTPMLAAWFVAACGGLNEAGLRPLYGLQAGVFALVFLLLLAFFRDRKVAVEDRPAQGVLSAFVSVFARGRGRIIRLLLLASLLDVPFNMTMPFIPLFAHQLKGADEYVIGGIMVARNVTPLLFSIIAGRLADRRGRKMLLYLVSPLIYAGFLSLIFAQGTAVLLLAGLLFGFTNIAVGIGQAMAAEVVPKEQMGRWLGMISLVRAALSVPAPLLGGFIWDAVSPEAVFLAAIAIDLVVRLPLLASIPETLHLSLDRSGDDAPQG